MALLALQRKPLPILPNGMQVPAESYAMRKFLSCLELRGLKIRSLAQKFSRSVPAQLLHIMLLLHGLSKAAETCFVPHIRVTELLKS